jgi:hypothetical protein
MICIRKLSFFGIEILEFTNNKCHLVNSTNQLHVTRMMIIGKNSILKLEKLIGKDLQHWLS